MKESFDVSILDDDDFVSIIFLPLYASHEIDFDYLETT